MANVTAVAKNVVADDITKYGATAVAVLTVLANAFPSFGLAGSWQAILDALIGVLTSVAVISKQKAVAAAKVTPPAPAPAPAS